MSPSKTFMKCLQFAALKHRDQRRNNANQTPYINHPINVATILSMEGNIDDESILMAALLHDTVEDTDTTFEEIEDIFRTEICNIVREVTDDKTLEKHVRKQLQIEHAAAASTKAKLIKLADKLDNLRDLEQILPNNWTEQRRDEYFAWAKKVVDNLRGTNKEIENELDEIFKRHQLL
ncbi:guanosine-3',5'-bis(diphosphate) 3'-pyrophosphohydrolase MESH1 [Calliphora vicina]|uniref:guanosine-3',5'-bis(diphosphate) 3'-pyrophosphohydrolase MESH1 n=1 Tax=Calliphora vicina TaxID=7373 RepID=UPI00325AA987